MIAAEGLRVQIGGATIVRGLSFQVERGEVAALFGPNGAGKTTTLRAVVGLYRHGGRVLLGGEDVSHLSPQERARLGLGYSPEDGGLFPSLTVYENLLLPVKTLKLDEGRMREVLEVVPVVKGLLDRKAYALSGGQRKFVALARALIVGRRAAVLDEIFEGLSPKAADDIKQVIKAVAGAGVSFLLAESTAAYIKGLVDSVYHIERGEIVQVEGAARA